MIDNISITSKVLLDIFISIKGINKNNNDNEYHLKERLILHTTYKGNTHRKL